MVRGKRIGRKGANGTRAAEPADLSGLIPEQDWAIQRQVLLALERRSVPYAVGGGVAFSALSGRWRYTKDVDVFLRPQDRDAAVASLREAGFGDYFEKEPYDRGWISRGYRDGQIFDVIWQMANYRAQVDEVWVTRGAEASMYGDVFRVLPPEELVWAKLYIVQRGRCDWPDVLSVIHAKGAVIDWERLLERVGDDHRLLAGLLATYSWLAPGGARSLPGWIWGRLGLADPPVPLSPDAAHEQHRVNWFDSRDWFGPCKKAA